MKHIKNGGVMKGNRVWIAMLIMGICFIVTGLIQIYWKNYILSVWQIIMGIVEIILALIQRKSEK